MVGKARQCGGGACIHHCTNRGRAEEMACFAGVQSSAGRGQRQRGIQGRKGRSGWNLPDVVRMKKASGWDRFRTWRSSLAKETSEHD